MQNKLMLVSFGLLITVASFSQSGYQPGFIVSVSGDTTHGFIENKSLQSMGSYCLFKKTENSEFIKYTADELNSFEFTDGKYYKSKQIRTAGQLQKRFLEYLVHGIADLYYFKDAEAAHFFIQKGNDSLVELKNTQVVKTVDDQQHVVQKKEYIGMLHLIFSDVPQLQNQINASSFDHKSLVRLTKKYHNLVCDSFKCIVYEKNTKLKATIGFIAGEGISNIKFKVKDNFYYSFMKDETFRSQSSFTAGIYLSLSNLFGISENLSVNSQLGFSKTSFQSDNILISMQYCSIPVYFSYIFPTGNLKPFINIGVTNSFSLGSDVTLANSAQKKLLEQAISPHQLHGLIGIGGEYKRNKVCYRIFATYETGTGVTRFGKATIGEDGFQTGSLSNNYISSASYAIRINLGLTYSFD
jgi:hypothetical protein